MPSEELHPNALSAESINQVSQELWLTPQLFFYLIDQEELN